MSCKCYDQINKLLKTRNGQLVGTIRFDNSPQRAIVAIEKADIARREKPPLLSANFCPFCGVEYAAKVRPTKVKFALRKRVAREKAAPEGERP